MNALRAIVRDQVVDIRCAEGRDADIPGMLAYAQKCRAQLALIYRNRHGVKLDRYGWPSRILQRINEEKI